MSYQSQREFNNWVEVTNPRFSNSSLVITGYKNNFETKYQGFSNYSTFKIAQAITDYHDLQSELKANPNKLPDLTNSITSTLGGYHFNTYLELKEYMLKYRPLDCIKPEEYEYVNWKELWTQMGHEDDFGLRADWGITGSAHEQELQANPDYDDLLDKLSSDAPTITTNERKAFALENAVIIIKGLLHRIADLKRCPQAVDAIAENKISLKRAIMSLVQAFGKIPTTNDGEVDAFLSKCRLA